MYTLCFELDGKKNPQLVWCSLSIGDLLKMIWTIITDRHFKRASLFGSPPRTPNSQFKRDIWLNHHFLCKKLASSNWSNHFKLVVWVSRHFLGCYFSVVVCFFLCLMQGLILFSHGMSISNDVIPKSFAPFDLQAWLACLKCNGDPKKLKLFLSTILKMVGFCLDDGSFPNPLQTGCFTRIHQPIKSIKMVVGRPGGDLLQWTFYPNFRHSIS